MWMLLNYDFLVLSLLACLPPAIVAVLRPDLRRIMAWTALLSLPFALTEPLFYPDYWTPRFLFDLGPRIGFGIEDFLFVAALGCGAITAYPTFTGKTFTYDTMRLRIHRLGPVFFAVVLGVAVSRILAWPLIWTAVILMLLAAAVVAGRRRDLIPAGLGGGAIYGAMYFLVCLMFGAIYPDAFRTVWHTSGLSDIYVAGVPAEELAYGAACGVAAAVCLPFLLDVAYRPRRAG